jgi:hypothetical protein
MHPLGCPVSPRHITRTETLCWLLKLKERDIPCVVPKPDLTPLSLLGEIPTVAAQVHTSHAILFKGISSPRLMNGFGHLKLHVSLSRRDCLNSGAFGIGIAPFFLLD